MFNGRVSGLPGAKSSVDGGDACSTDVLMPLDCTLRVKMVNFMLCVSYYNEIFFFYCATLTMGEITVKDWWAGSLKSQRNSTSRLFPEVFKFSYFQEAKIGNHR